VAEVMGPGQLATIRTTHHERGSTMSGKSAALLELHLAELKERKALYAAAHPELGPMELRRSYWEQESRRRRTSRLKEVNALIRLVKESMKQPEFWDE
jgi:hypothetical protein